MLVRRPRCGKGAMMDAILFWVACILCASGGFILGAIAMLSREDGGQCLGCRLENDPGDSHG